ncbi:MAG: TonB-dependent receptor domain-containing protein, partial [Pseudonocardiaceae bacterium]
YSKGSTHFDSGPTTDDVNHQTLSAYSVYSQNQLTPIWLSLLRLGAGRDENVSTGNFASEFQTDQNQATWQNTFKLGASTLIAGYDYLEQKVASDTPFTVSRRTINSPFAGYRGDYGRHGIEANLRRDDNSQFGTPTTGSVGYGYRFTPTVKLRAAFGTAFHAPTFNDLYFPGLGNPDLQPERSRNREIGIDYQTGEQRFAATFFDNRIAQLIVFVFDPVTFNGAPQNIARARIRGTELTYQGTILSTQLRARLTLQDPADDLSGFQLQRRAKQFGSIAAHHSWGAWKVGVEGVASGQRFDSPNESPASRLPGYALVNLFVTRRLSPEWLIEVR